MAGVVFDLDSDDGHIHELDSGSEACIHEISSGDEGLSLLMAENGPGAIDNRGVLDEVGVHACSVQIRVDPQQVKVPKRRRRGTAPKEDKPKVRICNCFVMLVAVAVAVAWPAFVIARVHIELARVNIGEKLATKLIAAIELQRKFHLR